jgi:glycosyltransferase involved in cell wall biosynthesis
MRILFVAPGAQKGSHMPFVRREADALRAAGHDVQIFGFDNSTYRTFFSQLMLLRRVARALNPDIVHAQFGKFNAALAAFSGRPFVITFRGTDINHNTKYSWLRSALGLAASQLAALFARGIVCVSREIQQKVWACRLRPSIVMPTGVDLRLFRPMDRAAARRKLGYGSDEHIVLFNAGKNPAVKDPELAAAALCEAKARVGEIRFVVLDGTAQPGDIPVYMNAADVLLVTSRTEGSPTVVQEAMACDLPVVSVDVGDVRERLEGVTACYVIPGRSPADIGTALAAVLSEGRRSDGRSHARSLGIDAIAARLIQFYRQVLSQRSLTTVVPSRFS